MKGKIAIVDWRDRAYEPGVLGVFLDETSLANAIKAKEEELEKEGYIIDPEDDRCEVRIRCEEVYVDLYKLHILLDNCVQHIIDFEDKEATTVLKGLGFDDEELEKYGLVSATPIKVPRQQESNGPEVAGIIYKHGEDDYELWEGFCFSTEEESALNVVLREHETEGCSVRGTKREIADDFADNYDKER